MGLTTGGDPEVYQQACLASKGQLIGHHTDTLAYLQK
jgi:hypothetical protein